MMLQNQQQNAFQSVRPRGADRPSAVPAPKGVGENAGPVEIRAAHRQLAQATHPALAADLRTEWSAATAPQPAPASQGDALSQAARDVLAEVEHATHKFPTWPTDPLHALAVLGEEFGELTKDMLQLTYEPHKTSAEKVRTEALQTAAMALRLLMSLERYEYLPCTQHSQQEGGAA